MKVVSDSTCDLCGEYVPEGEGWLCPGCRAALKDAERAGINVELVPYDFGSRKKEKVKRKHEKSLLRSRDEDWLS